MNEHQKNAKILAFVGLTGSGKSEAVHYICNKGYPRVYFGGVVLGAMKDAGIEWTEANEKEFREDIRRREGKEFVVTRIIKEIHDLINAGQRRIIADGLYTWTEYKALKHEFPGELTVVAVVAPKHIRHHRLTIRPVRPLTIQEANERDWAEIENLEKGGPIAIADYYVHNGGDRESLYHALDTVLKDSEF
ncbi:dephospho-CoA kinase [Candidatus Saccharibacteria bacterium]|nr:dephospho-CoA kinase [Candidatus Saccharibacteria bacterium]